MCQIFPKNEGFSVFFLRVGVPCCPGSPAWPACPPSHGGGFLEEEFQVREGFCTGSPGVVAPGGVWQLGLRASALECDVPMEWHLKLWADGWSVTRCALSRSGVS